LGINRVRYSELRPSEFRARLRERPVAYLPLGTLEWHGEHLPLGSDAIISEGLMIECARRLGGIVLPPLFLGPDKAVRRGDGRFLYGMDNSRSTIPARQLDGSCYRIEDDLLDRIVDAILSQVKRAGFRAVFADGHGPSRWAWVEKLIEREARFDLALFGAPPGKDSGWPSQRDHAARIETSQVMALRPDLADLSRLSSDRAIWPQGVSGEDPRDSNSAYGWECIEGAITMIDEMFRARGI
jgi:creatinine amidohydrolase